MSFVRDGMAASLQRIGLVAGQTLREAIRQRVFQGAAACGLVLAGAAGWFRQFDFGRGEVKFLLDFGLGGLALLSGVLAVAAMAQLFHGEVESRQVQTVLAKPVRRSEWLVGRWLGVVWLLGLWLVPLGGLVAAWVWVREGQLLAAVDAVGGRQVPLAGLAAAVALLWLRAMVVGAATLVVAVIGRGLLFAVVVGLLVLAIGQWQHLAADAWARAESWPAATAAWLVARAFPNLPAFLVAEPLAGGEMPPVGDLLRLAGYGMGYVAGYLALACHLFRRREP